MQGVLESSVSTANNSRIVADGRLADVVDGHESMHVCKHPIWESFCLIQNRDTLNNKHLLETVSFVLGLS